MALTFPVEPMKAVLSTLPPESDDENWAYEIKWDGYRTLRVRRSRRASACRAATGSTSRRSTPSSPACPQAVDAKSAVLDGELVVFDDERPADVRADAAPRDAGRVPGVRRAVDRRQRRRSPQPYEQRRELLAELVEHGSNWTVPGHRIGGGRDLLAAATERDLEGVMAKRLGSPYQPGKRTPNWRKVKIRRTVEVVIGGYTGGTGNRSSSFGALLVGRAGTTTARCGSPAASAPASPSARSTTLLALLRTLRTDDVPVHTDAAARVHPRRDVGRAGAHGDDRAHRVHQRGLRPPRQLHRLEGACRSAR